MGNNNQKRKFENSSSSSCAIDFKISEFLHENRTQGKRLCEINRNNTSRISMSHIGTYTKQSKIVNFSAQIVKNIFSQANVSLAYNINIYYTLLIFEFQDEELIPSQINSIDTYLNYSNNKKTIIPHRNLEGSESSSYGSLKDEKSYSALNFSNKNYSYKEKSYDDISLQDFLNMETERLRNLRLGNELPSLHPCEPQENPKPRLSNKELNEKITQFNFEYSLQGINLLRNKHIKAQQTNSAIKLKNVFSQTCQRKNIATVNTFPKSKTPRTKSAERKPFYDCCEYFSRINTLIRESTPKRKRSAVGRYIFSKVNYPKGRITTTPSPTNRITNEKRTQEKVKRNMLANIRINLKGLLPKETESYKKEEKKEEADENVANHVNDYLCKFSDTKRHYNDIIRNFEDN